MYWLKMNSSWNFRSNLLRTDAQRIRVQNVESGINEGQRIEQIPEQLVDIVNNREVLSAVAYPKQPPVAAQ